MEYLITYGLISLFILVFYFAILEKRRLRYFNHLLSRDLIQHEFTQDYNNYSIEVENLSNKQLNFDSLGIGQSMMFSKFFPRFRKCLGSDLFDFLDKWLISISEQKKMSYSISSDHEFLQSKLTRLQLLRTLNCIRRLVSNEVDNIDILLLFKKNKVILECQNIRKKECENSNRVIIRI